MDNTPLKPCPFCGSEVTIDHDDGLSFFRCAAGSTCAGSGLIAFCATEQVVTAIVAWNTRAALKAQPSGAVLPEYKAEPNPTWAAAPHVGRPLNAEEITEARAYNSALNEVTRLNKPASAGDERADFDKWFRREQLIAEHIDTTFIDSAFLPYRAWQARAALSANHSEEVPKDWQLVPVEPTDAMVKVGVEARWQRPTRNANSVREIYRAMLAAAAQSAGSQEKDHGL